VTATVRELWRYPVKSMQGERVAELELGPEGAAGDRAWAVRDERRGGIRGAKKIPELMRCAATYPETPAPGPSRPARITLPDGSTVTTGDEDVHRRLSEALGTPVTLWPLLPPEAVEHYRRGAPTHADLETELRTMFGRDQDEPLPDLSKPPPELFEFESPPGTYFDALPVLVMTTSSLARLEAAAEDSVFDVRRFRPNVLVETGDAPGFPEDGWVGGRLRLGEVELAVETACPRCVMTTHPFAELPKDPAIMRALVREHGGDLGVYCRVLRPGHVREGDAVQVMPGA
jgi:uncharacterized protein YcbX